MLDGIWFIALPLVITAADIIISFIQGGELMPIFSRNLLGLLGVYLIFSPLTLLPVAPAVYIFASGMFGVSAGNRLAAWALLLEPTVDFSATVVALVFYTAGVSIWAQNTLRRKIQM